MNSDMNAAMQGYVCWALKNQWERIREELHRAEFNFCMSRVPPDYSPLDREPIKFLLAALYRIRTSL